MIRLTDDRDLMNELDALSIITDVLPSQWVDRLRGLPRLQGEMGLMLAVLESACWDLQNGNAGKQEEAIAWLTDRGPAPFSFIQVCDVFSWDADWMRTGVLLWSALIRKGKAEHIKRRRPVLEFQHTDGKRYGTRKGIRRFA